MMVFVAEAITDSETALDSRTLFSRYSAFVASFLYRLGAPVHEIEDLVQDVFIIAHKRGGYRPGAASPKTFLALIALEAKLANERRDNRWIMAHRSELAGITVGDRPEEPESFLATKRAADKFQRILNTIDSGARTVFILFELQGESCESISAGLGIKLGTVYSRLHNARNKFLSAARGDESRGSPSSERAGDIQEAT